MNPSLSRSCSLIRSVTKIIGAFIVGPVVCMQHLAVFSKIIRAIQFPGGFHFCIVCPGTSYNYALLPPGAGKNVPLGIWFTLFCFQRRLIMRL
jgi:hypothetical protein